MSTQPVQNPFLSSLLALQQDGSGAISAPSNWVRGEPLLRVRTSLDDIISSLAKDVQARLNGGGVARWHFFVGSPGNGKSAAAGALARELKAQGCRICDEGGTLLEDIPEDHIPYLLQVFEGDNKYPTTWIAQDASVVRDPYGLEADPASELLGLVKEAAQNHVSLVICTNRGVLEKALGACYLDKEKSKEPWFIALKAAAEAVSGQKITLSPLKGKKETYSHVVVTTTKLDKVSLLLNSDIGLKLVASATAEGKWQPCSACPAINKCPFYNNRQWLTSRHGTAVFLGLLQRAELLSGQIIVFRELIALLSLILAGCPKDYADESPCAWVQRNLSKGNIFALVARRVYMTLFSSFSPSGLEPDAESRQEQCRLLREVLNEGSALPENVRNAIAVPIGAVKGDIVSMDVGVQRLLGRSGTLHALDPIREPLPTDFLERWAFGRVDQSTGRELFCELETSLVGIFAQLAEKIETSVIASFRHYYWLSRWYTSISFRLGALIEGRFTWGSELNRLADVLRDLGAMTSGAVNDPAMYIRAHSIEKELVSILFGGNAGVQVSEYGRLRGAWVTERLRPRIDATPSSDDLGLPLRFGDAGKETLNAEAFSWLLRKLERGMSTKSFPVQHLETVQDALTRAAASSSYSIADDDVELEAILPNEKVLVLRRMMGHVSVDER